MAEYTELIKALRFETDYVAVEKTMRDAAAAIEDLQADIKRLKEANEELREKQTFIDNWGTRWGTSAKDVPDSAYKHGYADGKYEALTLEECIDRLHELGWLQEHDRILSQPKRGEWIYKPKDAIEMMFTLPKCSVCGHESSDANNYCPQCGAKMMEVQK